MYFFFNLTIKSPERPRWCHSAILLLWSQWLSFFYLKWYPLFLNQSQKSKKFHDVRKSGDVQQTKCYIQKVLFIMRILYTKLQSYSPCYWQTKWYSQKIPSITGILSAKCQNYNICMSQRPQKKLGYILLHTTALGCKG